MPRQRRNRNLPPRQQYGRNAALVGNFRRNPYFRQPPPPLPQIPQQRRRRPNRIPPLGVPPNNPPAAAPVVPALHPVGPPRRNRGRPAQAIPPQQGIPMRQRHHNRAPVHPGHHTTNARSRSTRASNTSRRKTSTTSSSKYTHYPISMFLQAREE